MVWCGLCLRMETKQRSAAWLNTGYILLKPAISLLYSQRHYSRGLHFTIIKIVKYPDSVLLWCDKVSWNNYLNGKREPFSGFILHKFKHIHHIHKIFSPSMSSYHVNVKIFSSFEFVFTLVTSIMHNHFFTKFVIIDLFNYWIRFHIIYIWKSLMKNNWKQV